MPRLTEIKTGVRCFLVRVHGMNRERSQRLSDMGILPGETLKVVSNQGHGPVTISVKGTRMAIGHMMAASLEVKEVMSEKKDAG